MAYIELVIKVDENRYKASQRKVKNPKAMLNDVDVAIATGIPLPKGHGRLIDADAVLEDPYGNTYKDIEIAETIIEADTKSEVSK